MVSLTNWAMVLLAMLFNQLTGEHHAQMGDMLNDAGEYIDGRQQVAVVMTTRVEASLS